MRGRAQGGKRQTGVDEHGRREWAWRMKGANGVDGAAAGENGANVCAPNEIASETKSLPFKADPHRRLSDMQMWGMHNWGIQMCETQGAKTLALVCRGLLQEAAQCKQCSDNSRRWGFIHIPLMNRISLPLLLHLNAKHHIWSSVYFYLNSLAAKPITEHCLHIGWQPKTPRTLHCKWRSKQARVESRSYPQ